MESRNFECSCDGTKETIRAECVEQAVEAFLERYYPGPPDKDVEVSVFDGTTTSRFSATIEYESQVYLGSEQFEDITKPDPELWNASMTHSPEPWSVKNGDIVDHAGETVVVAVRYADPLSLSLPAKREDVSRLVACVNALRYVRDPEAFMRQLRTALKWIGREAMYREHASMMLPELEKLRQFTDWEEYT